MDIALVDSVSRLALFRDLTQPELEVLLPGLEEASFGEGSWVVRRGQTDPGLYIIVDGEVSVVLEGEELAGPVATARVGRGPLRAPGGRRAVPAREPARDAAHAPDGGAAGPDDRRAADVTATRMETVGARTSARSMDYLPIAEHGIIGDLHSIALVGTDGTIDWYCCPSFDSPSVFGAILDKNRGGFYRIAPTVDDWTPKQLYLPDTNVLITRFLTPAGVGEVQDFMPIQSGIAAHRHRLIRRVLGVRGEMRFRLDLQPRFNYGRDRHDVVFHEVAGPDARDRERDSAPLLGARRVLRVHPLPR